MAGIALQVNAEENLRGVLGGLNGGSLAGVHGAAPVDAQEEAIGVVLGARVEQLPHHVVVMDVRFQRVEEPFGNALAACGFGEIVDAFVVAEQVVPERDPVFGVLLVVGKKLRD